MKENANGEVHNAKMSTTTKNKGKKIAKDDYRESWDKWSKKLKKRTDPRPVLDLIVGGKTSPVAWGYPDDPQHPSRTRDVVDQFYALNRSRKSVGHDGVIALDHWLDESRDRDLTADLGYEVVAILYALPEMSRDLTAAPWWAVFDRIFEFVSAPDVPSLEDDPLAFQLWRIEVPLTMAYQFPELPACRRLRKSSQRQLSKMIGESLDGLGLLAGAQIGLCRPLLGSWTRSLMLCHESGDDPLDADEKLQLEWMIRQALRLTRRDGTPAFAESDVDSWNRNFLDAAMQFSADPDDRAIADVVAPNKKSKRKTVKLNKLPAPAERSEWAEVGILRSSWATAREKLFVTYHDKRVQVELDCNNTLFSGPWNPEITVNGTRCNAESDFQETCWFSDDDVDYLELEMDLERQVVLQRQFLLSRSDRFMIVADVVLPKESGDIEYRCELPLHANLSVDEFSESREMRITADKPQAWAIPLELPEWRSEANPGSLSYRDDSLVLSQTQAGRALYAPLFFDLEPRRLRKPITWRRLTIAEKLELQPRDAAVGYRVQVGKRQWLIYRSLIGAASRTILGQHLSSEFFVGRFDDFGEATELISIA